MEREKTVKTLELYLEYCKDELKQTLETEEKDKFESRYMDTYTLMRRYDKERSKEYMKWWIRYDRL